MNVPTWVQALLVAQRSVLSVRCKRRNPKRVIAVPRAGSGKGFRLRISDLEGINTHRIVMSPCSPLVRHPPPSLTTLNDVLQVALP